MNKLKISLYTLASICLLSFTACDKEEEAEPIVGTWQKSKVEQSTNGGAWSTSSEPCQMDDTEEYASGGSWTAYDGPNQCSAGTGIIKGTWRLAANGSKVIYTYSGYSGEYESTVEQLNGSNMVLVYAVGDNNNTQVRTTFTKK